MFLSGTCLTMLLGGISLVLSKHYARRAYYSEVQQPAQSPGWHNDPSYSDPRSSLSVAAMDELGQQATLNPSLTVTPHHASGSIAK